MVDKYRHFVCSAAPLFNHILYIKIKQHAMTAVYECEYAGNVLIFASNLN